MGFDVQMEVQEAGRMLWSGGEVGTKEGLPRAGDSGVLQLKTEPRIDQWAVRLRGAQATPEGGEKGRAGPRRLAWKNHFLPLSPPPHPPKP